MAFHHLAIATRDAKATHEFYTGAMGFTLAKVEVAPAGERGFAKHLFYDTGNGEMIAFWDFHDADLPEGWSSAISEGLGLPRWANHIAFEARDLADIEARKRRWLDFGLDVHEVDHLWCLSIYATDPNGILVEWCTTTRAFTAQDTAEALRLLEDPHPALPTTPPRMQFHRARDHRRGAGS
jgi:catechol 2,3-dioxygenase-like lactoylglutathione lyase family enzyme